MVLAQTSKRPPSLPEKKRHGHHHKHTKHYEKPYWPYLPLFVVVIVGLVGNAWLSHRQHVLGATSGITASSLLQVTNAQRTSDHEQPLALNDELTSAAQAKANDMAARNYWSHNTPGGKTPWTFVQQSGYQYQLAAENLAYGFTSSNAAVTGWMNSAEHRANILNNAYTNVGFGIATANNYQGHGPAAIVVAMYAEPQSGVNAAPAVLGDQMALPGSQHVARIQLLTAGSAPWSLVTIAFLAGACAVLFAVRHGLFLRRAFVRSETFIIRHPILDVLLVVIGTLGFVLTRTSGFIQ